METSGRINSLSPFFLSFSLLGKVLACSNKNSHIYMHFLSMSKSYLSLLICAQDTRQVPVMHTHLVFQLIQSKLPAFDQLLLL